MNGFLSNDIKNYPDTILKEKSIEIAEIDNSIIVMARQLQKKLKETGGKSMSAVQMGVPISLIVVEIENDMPLLVMINPKVIEMHTEYISMQETCLSLPGIAAEITRPKRVIVEYMDLDGNLIKMQPNDDVSRRILHEMDHLEGKLFIDRIENEEIREKILDEYLSKQIL